MKKMIILIIWVLTGCSGYEEVFSPTYHDSACVPTQSLTYELPALNAAANASADPAACCGQKGGVVACCVGGYYSCVDGSTGLGCGCPAL